MTDQPHLFTRLAQTHKPDCAMALEGPLPEIAPLPDELAVTLGSETVAHYAHACRPIYEDLRRIIGQVSGLLVLAQLTAQRQLLDLPEYKACEERATSARARLDVLRAVGGTARHRAQLESALVFATAALSTLSAVRPESTEKSYELAGQQVKRAYAHLRAAGATKAGLEMVDLSQACGCCGQRASV